MTDYTPTTEKVRGAFFVSNTGLIPGDLSEYEPFDRWLAQNNREIAAKALEDAADELTPGDDKVDDWGIQAGLLRDRAQAIRGGDL